jgi:hypothetical protein
VHVVETRRIRPPLAGIFNGRVCPTSLQRERAAQFRPPSPRRKFPFLALKSCRVENVTSWLSFLYWMSLSGSRNWHRRHVDVIAVQVKLVIKEESTRRQAKPIELERPFGRRVA